jgi:hypothetical protein
MKSLKRYIQLGAQALKPEHFLGARIGRGRCQSDRRSKGWTNTLPRSRRGRGVTRATNRMIGGEEAGEDAKDIETRPST